MQNVNKIEVNLLEENRICENIVLFIDLLRKSDVKFWRWEG